MHFPSKVVLTEVVTVKFTLPRQRDTPAHQITKHPNLLLRKKQQATQLSTGA